jgi:hypothetical protein
MGVLGKAKIKKMGQGIKYLKSFGGNQVKVIKM